MSDSPLDILNAAVCRTTQHTHSITDYQLARVRGALRDQARELKQLRVDLTAATSVAECLGRELEGLREWADAYAERAEQ